MAKAATKQCGKCCQTLPATRQYFTPDSSKNDQYKTWCKACRRKESEGIETELIQNVQAELTKEAYYDQRELELAQREQELATEKAKMLVAARRQLAIETFSQSAVGSRDAIPHTQKVVEELLSKVGGVGGFTDLFLAQLFDDATSAAVRANMLSKVMDMIQKNVDQGGARKAKELMTDDELDAEYMVVETEIKERVERQLRLEHQASEQDTSVE